MKVDAPTYEIVTIVNPLGLHARPAAKLVQLAEQFNATVTVEKDHQVASTDSIMELMMLMAGAGDQIIIKTTGPQAHAALKAIVNLIQDGFGEMPGGLTSPMPVQPKGLQPKA